MAWPRPDPEWLDWDESDGGKEAKKEYTAACNRLKAESHEQFRQIHLQREARRMAWMGSVSKEDIETTCQDIEG